MDGKKLLLVGLVIAAGAAFVYFDPLSLDLLGLRQNTVVAKPAATPRAPTPVAKPPVIVPKAAVAPRKPKASVAVPTPAQSAVPVATSAVVAPKVAVAPMQPKTPVGSTTANPSASPSVPPVAKIVQVPLPPMKLSKETRDASKHERPKNQDLRYCLDLETNAAIAKCAGE
jgi:hypothetical protein